MNSVVNVHVDLNYLAKSKDKFDFLNEISSLLAENVGDKKLVSNITSALIERENLGTTGFGDNFAIPHGRVKGIDKSHVFFISLKEQIDWQSLDQKPVEYLFIILVSDQDESNEHLKILSALSYNLMDANYQDKIKQEKEKTKLKIIIEEMLKKQ